MKDLKGTRTEECLKAAYAGESQAHTKYLFYASRAKKDGEMFIPKENTVMEEGMKLYIVTATSDKEAIIALMGELLDEDWQKETEEEKRYISQRLIISKPEVNGMTFNDLHFSSLYNVNVTRVSRAGMTLFARRNFRLQMGDHIRVTGTEENINRVRGSSQRWNDVPWYSARYFLGTNSYSYPRNQRTRKAWFGWWPVGARYPHRSFWLQV